MTIKEMIELLESQPNKEMQVKVWDWKTGCHEEINSISPFDSDNPYSKDNILGININDDM